MEQSHYAGDHYRTTVKYFKIQDFPNLTTKGSDCLIQVPLKAGFTVHQTAAKENNF